MASPSVETSIYQAILARVETLPMLADYPLHWSDGPSYQPDPSKPYLRATWLPNRTRRLFLNGADPHQRPGILQIDVFGRVDFGAGVAKEVAGQIAAHFPADYRMSFGTITARVTAAPSLGPVFVDTHIQVPVTMLVESYC